MPKDMSSVVVYTCNPSTWDRDSKTRKPRPQMHSEFWTSLGYMRLSQK